MWYPADMKPSGTRNRIGAEVKMMYEWKINLELFNIFFETALCLSPVIIITIHNLCQKLGIQRAVGSNEFWLVQLSSYVRKKKPEGVDRSEV